MTDHLDALTDHVVALTDHIVVLTDHVVALTDHIVALTDHVVALTDHLDALTDHLFALTDHLVLLQAFSVFFVCIAVTSDVVCYLFIPVQWLFFAASTYVWVQYVWHTGRLEGEGERGGGGGAHTCGFSMSGTQVGWREKERGREGGGT